MCGVRFLLCCGTDYGVQTYTPRTIQGTGCPIFVFNLDP